MKTAVSEQTVEHLLWANNMLEVQNEVLQRTVADLRARVKSMKKKAKTLLPSL